LLSAPDFAGERAGNVSVNKITAGGRKGNGFNFN
jgi:hypothetical protein